MPAKRGDIGEIASKLELPEILARPVVVVGVGELFRRSARSGSTTGE